MSFSRPLHASTHSTFGLFILLDCQCHTAQWWWSQFKQDTSQMSVVYCICKI